MSLIALLAHHETDSIQTRHKRNKTLQNSLDFLFEINPQFTEED